MIEGSIWHAIVRSQIREYSLCESSSSVPTSIAGSEYKEIRTKIGYKVFHWNGKAGRNNLRSELSWSGLLGENNSNIFTNQASFNQA